MIVIVLASMSEFSTKEMVVIVYGCIYGTKKLVSEHLALELQLPLFAQRNQCYVIIMAILGYHLLNTLRLVRQNECDWQSAKTSVWKLINLIINWLTAGFFKLPIPSWPISIGVLVHITDF